MTRTSSALEHDLSTIRRMLRHLNEHAGLLRGGTGLAQMEVEDCIADGEYLLKRLGGVAARTAPVAPMVSHGPCFAAA